MKKIKTFVIILVSWVQSKLTIFSNLWHKSGSVLKKRRLCSEERACMVADIQLTLIRGDGGMNHGLTLEESTKIGMEFARVYTLEILREFDASTRRRRRSGDSAAAMVEYTTPITPTDGSNTVYALTAICLFATIMAIGYYFRAHLKTFKTAHFMVWNHGKEQSWHISSLPLFPFLARTLKCGIYAYLRSIRSRQRQKLRFSRPFGFPMIIKACEQKLFIYIKHTDGESKLSREHIKRICTYVFFL